MSGGKHIVFGTAGHVDHGKSTLVLALTGTDPDRWAEEKAREMTIDLGFAFLDLPGLAEPVALVDVPGHEMFIRNMVAGATGIDAALFVVAADEGGMPQTLEHFDVLRHLQVRRGVVAVTKADRVPPGRVAEVIGEARELLRGSLLEGAPCVAVSARTGQGLGELRDALAKVAAEAESRSAEGAFRLPVDRSFTLKGVGTVVTGTILAGSVAPGETVRCLPVGRDFRVRGVQVRNRAVGRALAGQRVAVNLADAAKEDVGRGDVLAAPGSLAPTMMLDVRLSLSAAAPSPLKQRARVRIHHGTKEVMARTVLLEAEALPLGGTALAQLRLEGELVAAAGDLFVVRTYSPMRVIGGGTVVDAHPPKRKPSAGAGEVARREEAPVGEVVAEALDKAGAKGMAFPGLLLLSGLSEPALRELLGNMAQEGQARQGKRGLWLASDAVHRMEEAIAERVAALHAKDPRQPAVPLNAVANAAAPNADEKECCRLALEALRERGTIVAEGQSVRLASHRPQWTGRDAALREAILGAFESAGLASPTIEEMAARAGVDERACRKALDALVGSGELLRLDDGIFALPKAAAAAREAVRGFLERNGTITIAQARDLLGASRKYLLPFLEMLDKEGLTAREGGCRVLRR